MILGLAGLYSCSNDLEILAPKEPVPIIFFLMDPADSIYYLTLTKSFITEENVYNIAQDSDKVFYESTNIRLEGWASQYKIWETRFVPNKITKRPGIFPINSGYCYESYNEFYPLDRYGYLGSNYDQITTFRLVLDLPGYYGPITASVKLIPYPIRIFPVTPLKVLDLYPDGSNYKAGIQFDPQYVKYCDLTCRFRYREFSDAGIWVNHSFEFVLRRNIQLIEDEAVTIIDPEMFFTKVASNFESTNDTLIRKFESLDLIFLVADGNFDDYNNSYINSGNLDSAPIGNIQNGYGMFTMVRSFKLESSMKMSYRTLDFLSSSKYTHHLGFVRW